ncbi:diguanylate cyclase [Shewanella sp.]|uniref:sensor domain-containing diguanylate cyclase n=1 Tax=Shewanella sp. TaxID=50422 RepID=UPI0035689A7F
MHRLLKRQLRRYFPDGLPESEELAAFVNSVNDSYNNFSCDEAILGHSLDISSQELNERNDTLNSLLDALPDTCIWVDEFEVIRDIRLGQQLDGLFSAADKFKCIDDIALLKGQHSFRSYLLSCRKNNRPERHECQLTLGNEQIFIETRFSPLKNMQVLVVFRDITMRKVVERLKNAALEESQRSGKQLQELINGAPIGIMLIDNTFNVIMVNSYASAHLGMATNELLGQRCDAFIEPAFRKQYLSAIGQCFSCNDSACESRFDVSMCSPRNAPFAAELACSTFNHGGRLVLTQAFTDISARKQMEKELRRLAQTDPLTGVANRRFFITRGQAAFDSSKQSGHSLSLLAMDLDHFKSINDSYGHAIGDEVLKCFCRTLETVVGKDALIGRFGGEEFTLLLPDIDKTGAESIAAKVLDGVTQQRIETAKGNLGFTTSIGIASLNEADSHLESLLNLADARLYRAKHGGRNCYCSGD